MRLVAWFSWIEGLVTSTPSVTPSKLSKQMVHISRSQNSNTVTLVIEEDQVALQCSAAQQRSTRSESVTHRIGGCARSALLLKDPVSKLEGSRGETFHLCRGAGACTGICGGRMKRGTAMARCSSFEESYAGSISVRGGRRCSLYRRLKGSHAC
ncbi:hypothetical protein CC80DRAFT_10218 [Byssothecium circinans]|uniref:Uncharacterized protein n=1 Tax=Byssothecium circinans TaxID=147558 RepID=A0A6A5UGY6_9PLEO|nr:hypothetical protein CC80DRAFT_10218 [Byssothecium circinans]